MREADCQIAPTRRKPGLRNVVPQAPGPGGDSSSDDEPGDDRSRLSLDPPKSSGEPAAPAATRGEADASGRWSDAGRGFWEWSTLPTAEEATVVSRTLEDIVRMVTAAHRLDHGDLVWLGWQPWGVGQKPHAGRKQRIGFATLALTVTRTAAEILRDNMPRIPTGHWDLGLLKFLENDTCSLKGCYLWPPLGSYIEHVSGCDPKFAAGRPGCWRESFACEGTRVADDRHHREKYFAAFRPKNGPPRWLNGPLKIDDPAKDYRWFTLQPDNLAQTSAGASSSTTPATPKPGSIGLSSKYGDGRQHRGLQHQQQRREGFVQELQTTTVITMTTASGELQAPATKRQMREQRSALRNYARRNFTTDPDKAFAVLLAQCMTMPLACQPQTYSICTMKHVFTHIGQMKIPC